MTYLNYTCKRITSGMIVLAGIGMLWSLPVVSDIHGVSMKALAEDAPDPRETGAETVRRRQQELEAKEGETLTGKYWTPFELARAGRCDEAVADLKVLAERGRGYENAQHVFGLCLIETGNTQDGKMWVRRAAEAGLADAQASHLRAYLADGTDYLAHDVAAKWLHLYRTNPLRLAIGTEQALEPNELEGIQNKIPRADYLSGVQAARSWTPTFWTAAQTTDIQ
ncbi:MAG: hypothetical protein ACFB0Z_12965 [Candidatus Phaeomarinobacter sp.]|mgnify:CR=1 FL=1